MITYSSALFFAFVAFSVGFNVALLLDAAETMRRK